MSSPKATGTPCCEFVPLVYLPTHNLAIRVYPSERRKGQEDREQPFPPVFFCFISQVTEEQILTRHCDRLNDKPIPIPSLLCVYVLLQGEFQFAVLESG